MPEIEISTFYWAILFGSLICCMALILLGEGIFTFVDVQERSDELNEKMYLTSLQQLIMAIFALFVGVSGIILWKMEKVNTTVMIGLAFFAFVVAVFVASVFAQHRSSMAKNLKSSTENDRSFGRRSANLMFADMGLFGLLLAFSILMIWLSKYGDDGK